MLIFKCDAMPTNIDKSPSKISKAVKDRSQLSRRYRVFCFQDMGRAYYHHLLSWVEGCPCVSVLVLWVLAACKTAHCAPHPRAFFASRRVYCLPTELTGVSSGSGPECGWCLEGSVPRWVRAKETFQ